jgi:dynein heavy chain
LPDEKRGAAAGVSYFLFFPLYFLQATMADKADKNGVYLCPVYKTQVRGPTYVFTAQLRSKHVLEKWTLGGVAMVMEVVDG